MNLVRPAPEHLSSHIGYAVVPWKQRRGYATVALRLMLREAANVGLPFVEITTDPANTASRRVIEAAGGAVHDTFTRPSQFGGGSWLRYRITLR